MEEFRGVQRTLTFKQRNLASPDKVFPLLCPVLELDWLDGWHYRMIHSVSGVAEENCVFATPNHGTKETIWHITKHDAANHEVEFVRVTPEESVVRINIKLSDSESGETDAFISYQYTGLNPEQNKYITNGLEKDFTQSMEWWEKAINHYLKTGIKLMKTSTVA